MSTTSKDLNIFQVATIALFAVIGILGVVLFATSKVRGGGSKYESTIWGVLPKTTIDEALVPYRDKGIDPNFTYVEFEEAGFSQKLLQAVAEGKGPDAIIFPSYMYYEQLNKLVTIPSETITAKDYFDTYIDAGHQFSIQGGIKAFPLVTDPMIMYWNKDMFTSAGILIPPKSWSELANMTNKIAQKKDNGVIDTAFVALGEYSNINHAKEVLYTLLTQAGVQMSYFDLGLLKYVTGLNKSAGAAEAESGQTSIAEITRSVLTYYTEFANPLKDSYTWNRSFTSARDAFLANKLALYFGPASEVEYIRTRNPNLNFGVAVVPQEVLTKKAVHTKTYALGFLVTSPNVPASYAEITKFFNTPDMIGALANAMRIAPARRDVLANAKSAKTDSDLAVIYESAVYGSTWTDPAYEASNNILKTLVESITSGNQTLSEAVSDAADRIDTLYGN